MCICILFTLFVQNIGEHGEKIEAQGKEELKEEIKRCRAVMETGNAEG